MRQEGTVLWPPELGRDNNDQKGFRVAYRRLLDEDAKEQTYQRFIERNTWLVPREFVLNHGIWCNLVFRKLRLGSDYVCDFAFLTKSSVRWRLVLIEIERPGKKFFRGSTLRLHSDFTKATGQISTWRSFLDGRLAGFVRETLGSVATFPQIEDPGDVRFVLVHGRRSEYERIAKRRRLIKAQEPKDFRIMSFDSLVENPKPRWELYLAIRTNEFIDIMSDHFISDDPFEHLAPENIRISTQLRASAESALKQRYGHANYNDDHSGSNALNVLSRVRIRNG